MKSGGSGYWCKLGSAAVLAGGLMMFSSLLFAGTRIVIPADYQKGSEFRLQVKALIDYCRKSDSAYLNRFSEYLDAAPVDILISPVTEDSVTWYGYKDKTRSHVRPEGEEPLEFGRLKPTVARVYIHPPALQPGHPEYQSGVVMHQLTHAVDIAYGRFHPTESIRERRAVFMENIWRDEHGYALKDSFENRIPATEYLRGRDIGQIGAYIEYIFNASEFPYQAHGTPEGG